MNTLDRLKFLGIMAHMRLTWNRRNTRYAYHVPGNPKFMGPREAVGIIPDGAVIATSGMTANQRPSIMYWAIREVFQETGHPAGLTVITTGGQGGRGRAPGTIEELGLPGLCTRLITGHLETYRAMLKLGKDNLIDLQSIPLGVITLLFDGQSRGEYSVVTHIGSGTMLDPRTGRGSPLLENGYEHLTTVEGDKLRYTIPPVTAAIFNAYAADEEGNIYVTYCPLKAEILEITRAAKHNGGVVIANVSRVVPKGYDEVYVPSELVDAVVVYPKTEQSGFMPYHSHMSFLAPYSDMPVDEAIERLRFVNKVMGLTPKRRREDDMLARLGAKVFTDNVYPGALANIGVGLPEEVSRVLFRAGVLEKVTLFTECGVFGGNPAPGFFFGAAARPGRIISSVETFRIVHDRLDAAILGVLQVDSEGNVNVSKRGEDLTRYVGAGGFIDMTMSAKAVVFVTKWMDGMRMQIGHDQVKITRRGSPKFVSKVDEVTFNGPNAVRAGKRIFYVTNVGAFRLTERGVELMNIMPGIDIQRDILDVSGARICLPENGHVPTVDLSIVTGQGFSLHLPQATG